MRYLGAPFVLQCDLLPLSVLASPNQSRQGGLALETKAFRMFPEKQSHFPLW